MAELQICPRCGSKIIAHSYPDGTSLDLQVAPSPAGVWAMRNGVPVCAVTFKSGKVVGRLPGFEADILHSGHYGIVCAEAAAKRAQGMAAKKASGS